MAEASPALRNGPGIAGEPTVFGGRRPGQQEIFSPVDGQRFVDVAAGIDKGALRSLSREGEYLGLVGQLEVAAAAGEHAAIAQVGQLRAQALHRAVDTSRRSGEKNGASIKVESKQLE